MLSATLREREVGREGGEVEGEGETVIKAQTQLSWTAGALFHESRGAVKCSVLLLDFALLMLRKDQIFQSI